MQHTERLELAAAPEQVRPFVEDLMAYPEWFDLLSTVRPVVDDAPDSGEAWVVDLRGRIGQLARSKRLRMVRTIDEADRVRFERRELADRPVSAWVLEVQLAPTAESTTLTMRLEYGGRLWGPLIERVLSDAIDRARPRLRALAEAAP